MERTPGYPPPGDDQQLSPAGRNTHGVATRTGAAAAEEVTAEDIRSGLRIGEFTAHYLPIVEHGDDGHWRIVAAEALARWHRDGRPRPLLPAEFMPAAENAGLVSHITDYILQQAVEQTRVWHACGVDIGLTVNLDARLLTDPGVPDRLERLMHEYDVEPARLTLEFTEVGPIAEPKLTIGIMTNLRRKGFRLALDDFGTGYSSLTQLSLMPFDELKLDRSLMVHVPGNVKGERILRALVQLGQTLGLGICAEGVDREDLFRFVTELGCERLQGHLISPAMPAARMQDFYRRWNDGSLAA